MVGFSGANLTYVRKRTLEWREAPDPVLEADTDALVRPFAVARCDLDNAFLHHDLGVPIRSGKWLHGRSRAGRTDHRRTRPGDAPDLREHGSQQGRRCWHRQLRASLHRAGPDEDLIP